ncbi:MAG: ATP-dependent zinc metalloprotease FtsH [Brevinematales bacterium]|nr:ATP-dependent zinc metalloprotease FtsH [Brevinematales bacterium]
MKIQNNKPSNNLQPNNDRSSLWSILIILVIGGLIIYLASPIGNVRFTPEISYTEFTKMVKNKQVIKVTIENGRIIYGEALSKDKGGVFSFKVLLPHFADSKFLDFLTENGVDVYGRDTTGMSDLINILLFVGILIGGLLLLSWFFGRQVGNNPDNTRIFNFTRSRARIYKDPPKKVTFKDVAGIEEVKEEVMEIVDFLKDPKKYIKIGARIPKGILFVGPPGTGKTLLAKAIAGEAGVPFLSMSGSEFVEMFVGVGASRVRDLFDQARKNAPCIVFIDEIDAVGRFRGAGLGGGHDEREQTLNQLLAEMDGFDSQEGIIVIAATNRPDILDPALLRPGRFDRQIVVDIPDIKAREEILKVHIKKIQVGDDVDISVIAKSTPGFTGADLENLVNEAALIAARENSEKVCMKHFEKARDKVLMGPEKKVYIITPEEKTITAFHEAGHAVVAHLLPYADPIYKVSIIPRGRALGVTQQLPINDRKLYNKEMLLQMIMGILGGRAAEEITFGPKFISNGAQNDIEKATKIARAMVCEWGMSDLLGPIQYGEKEGPVFLGKDIVVKKTYSDRIAEVIDSEIKSIVNNCYTETINLLKQNIDKLKELAKELLQKETLSSEDIERILGKKPEKNDVFSNVLTELKPVVNTN